MYLHIGLDVCVKIKDIVAIMDLETTSTSKITREFLRRKNYEAVEISDEIPKSYVITNSMGKTRLYISPISSQTLLKRAENVKEHLNLL